MKKINYRPKRTLRVVLYMNEENGQRGAAKYTEIAQKNNENHVFALESDAGGFTPRGFLLTPQRRSLKRFNLGRPILSPT